MSDFCDFVPDDPSCQQAPPPQPTDGGRPEGGEDRPDGGEDRPDGGAERMDGDKDWSDHDGGDKEMTWEQFDEKASEYFHPMEANIVYFSVAAGFVTDIVLRTFVWHESNADTLSQAASGSGNTDYYSLMHQIEAYGGLAVWGTAALTQLLATFGIMVGINLMVWNTVVPMLGGLLELAVAVIAFLAYNQFWDQYQLATPNATAESYMNRMEREMANHEASHIAGHFEMYHELPSWLWGAYMASSEEEKEKWRSDKEFLMMLDLTPEKVEKWGKGGDMEMKEMKEGDDKMMDGPPSLMLKFVNI